MNLFPEMNISGAGLAVERTRMQVIARNIANANTTKTENGGGAFRRQLVEVTEQADLGEGVPGPAVVGLTEDPSPLQLVFDPHHPDANKAGYVAKPNVDVMTEMVDLMTASHSYEANVTVLQNAKDIAKLSLDI
jgi:flagellar basal-body rod protein FlgC